LKDIGEELKDLEKLMKEIGYGKEYKYPHEFKDHFILEEYLPEKLRDAQYYFPTENGQEKRLKEWLKFIWKSKKKF